MKFSTVIIGFFVATIFLNSPALMAQAIEKQDLDYLYIGSDNSRKNLYDIRKKESRISDVGNGTMMFSDSLKRILFCDQYIIRTFKIDGTKVAQTAIKGYLSPDWKYKLFVKGKDIWRATFNWSSGTFEQEKRLTELGIFSPRLKIFMWYEEWIVLQTYVNYSYKTVLFNSRNGSIQELPFAYPRNVGGGSSNVVVSPTARYIANSVYSESDYIFDFKELSKIPLIDHSQSLVAFSGCWMGHNRYFLREETRNAIKLYDVNLPQKERSFMAEVSESFHYWFDHVQHYHNRMAIAKASTNHSYMLGIYDQRPLRGEIAIIDIHNNRILETGIKRSFGMSIEWIDDKTLIYGDKSDVLKQGTYLYDATTQEKIKITSAIIDHIVVLPDADTVFFKANDKIYRGTISERNFEVTTHFDNLSHFEKLTYSIAN